MSLLIQSHELFKFPQALKIPKLTIFVVVLDDNFLQLLKSLQFVPKGFNFLFAKLVVFYHQIECLQVRVLFRNVVK